MILAACATPDPASSSESESGEVAPMPADPYLWLEEIASERSLAWARERNAQSQGELVDEEFRKLEQRLKAQYDSAANIPFVQKIGAHYYNLWTDAQNPRGLWRRTTPEEYEKSAPTWETVLDIDALGRAEGRSWVWHGAEVLAPEQRLCLISLSPGGSDAAVVREFDLATKRFVEGGFALPEAKSTVSWRDQDHLWVGTDCGPGSLTASGYPRTARLWKRGTPLAAAPVAFEGREEDVWVSVIHDATPGFERDVAVRAPTFFTHEMFVRKDDAWVKVAKPDDAQASAWREWLLIQTRSDWTIGDQTFAAGSLIATKLEANLSGAARYEVLFAPSERVSLAGYTPTRQHLILDTLDNVKTRLAMLTPGERGWTRRAIPGLPELGTLHASAVDAHDSDEYFLVIHDFLSPVSLHRGTLGTGTPRLLKSMPAFFDARGLAVSQHEALSEDGTRIPYFEVRRADLALDGSAPTLLYAYGGFEISLTPRYDDTVGAAWLERGGVYVLANIRGGGEFGPAWHQAALKEKRLRCYEDLAAVARDLAARKITSAQHLGVMGGSNGGLMVGNMITLYPDLFRAAVCQVPLLDMRRFHLLLAGASWMGEYGNPDDPAEWAFLRTFSPYHNVQPNGSYPRTLFVTSTKDDRVHPGHARKMVARMQEQGHDVLYYENIEGGHGGAADSAQRAFLSALSFRFLQRELGGASSPALAPERDGAAQRGARGTAGR
ncbi:MAG: S9 family peptidase [Planctomycetes bacterium]|nr:S9 family peptidase [Planctomycetota bacterium]